MCVRVCMLTPCTLAQVMCSAVVTMVIMCETRFAVFLVSSDWILYFLTPDNSSLRVCEGHEDTNWLRNHQTSNGASLRSIIAPIKSIRTSLRCRRRVEVFSACWLF